MRNLYALTLDNVKNLYPENINDLTSLGWCENLELPILKLPNLKKLIVHSCQLKNLSCLSELTNLTDLKLSHNSLTDIDTICRLKKLENLDLSCNENLRILPHQFSSLQNLKSLELYNCCIEKIDTICSLTNLQDLNLYNNKIKSIPSAFGNLNKLKELDMSKNVIPNIPFSFGDLKNLEKLLMSDNKIRDFRNVCRCEKLVVLSLRNNHIEVVPSEVMNLWNLKDLSLSYNKIWQISKEWIIKGTHFQKSERRVETEGVLDFSHNCITDLKPLNTSAKHLTYVKIIRLYGNPIINKIKKCTIDLQY